MKNSFLLCLALFLPVTTVMADSGGGGGPLSSPKKLRLKGAKKSSTGTAANGVHEKHSKMNGQQKQQERDEAVDDNDDHRLLHAGHQGRSEQKHKFKMKGGAKILHGPSARSCIPKTSLQKWENSGRNGGKDDKQKDNKKNGKQEVSMTCTSLPRSASFNDGTSSRGIFLDPSTAIQDKIKYKIKTDNKGINIKVEYKKEYLEAYGVDEYQDSKTSFEVLFDSIVEYAKVDNAYPTYGTSTSTSTTTTSRTDEEQAYDWQNDIVVQTLSLQEWDNFTSVIESIDGVFSHFSVKSADKKAYFKFTISRSDFGQTVTANSMKIDFKITNFPWLRSDTNLALMSTVKTKNEVEMTYNDQAFTSPYNNNNNINGNMQQQQQHQPAKWSRNVEITFDQAIDNIGFVPFGEYSWEGNAQAMKTNASTTAAQNLFTDLCTSHLLEYAQSMDPYATMPPGCDKATLPQDPNLNPYAYNGGGGSSSSSSSYPIVATTAGVSVVATSPPPLLYGYENHQHISYSFVGENAQRAKEIFWDPKAGIGYVESTEDGTIASLSSSSSSSGGATAAAAAVSATSLSLVSAMLVGSFMFYGL